MISIPRHRRRRSRQVTGGLAVIAVAGSGAVADLAARAPAQTGDEFRIGSMSKTFIATVVLQLVAERRISLARPVQDYLPGLLPASDPPVTVAELFNRTSGLGSADGVVDTGDPQWFLEHRLDTYSTSQLVGPVLQQPLIFQPGTSQRYNAVSAGRGRDLAADRHQRAEPSLYGAQGDMISSAADLTRFMTALLRGRLLPAAQLGDMFGIPAVASGPFRYSMGLLAYTFPDGVTVWGHTGKLPATSAGFWPPATSPGWSSLPSPGRAAFIQPGPGGGARHRPGCLRPDLLRPGSDSQGVQPGLRPR
jgi:D-alanyl-D-alanine carboxypeptidase